MYLSPVPESTVRSEHPQNQPQPSLRRIFRVDDEVYARQFVQGRTRQPKNKFIILPRHLKRFGFLSFAPSPPLPSTEETGYPVRPGFSREKQVALEGQKHGRAFRMLSEGEDRRADFAARPERDVKIQRLIAGRRKTVAKNKLALRDCDCDRDPIRTGNCLLSQRYFRHSAL